MRNRGYSLIESLAAISIFAILIGMASLFFLNTSPKYQLLAAVREIHSRMNYARYKAIFKGQKVKIRFETDGYYIELFDESQNNWLTGPKNLVKGAILRANNNPTFHPIGTVSNLASIYIQNSWGEYKITIAISGRIKVTKVL